MSMGMHGAKRKLKQNQNFELGLPTTQKVKDKQANQGLMAM